MMNYSDDVFGQIVWSFYKGLESYQLIEREDGYVYAPASPSLYFTEFDEWAACEKEAISFACGNILDIGAGAGRNALYMQNQGLNVTALDNSPLALKVCAERKIKNTVLLPFENISSLSDTKYNTIVLLGNNFGLFSDFKKATFLLEQLYSITSPDALILAQSTNLFDGTEVVHSEYYNSNKLRNRMPGQIRMRFRFKQYIGDWFDFLFVSIVEMEEILSMTSWRIQKVFGTVSGKYVAVIGKR